MLRIYIALVFVSLFLITAADTLGCSCLPPPAVPGEFARSENVIIASLREFEEIDRSVEGTNVYRTYAAIFDVEKVYKGSLVEKETIRVFNGGGGDCTSGFERKDIGTKFLFYMGNSKVQGKYPTPLYVVGICSRSTSLKNAAPDLKYLDNRKALEDKTRFSGRIVISGENISLPSIAGLSIRIVGPKVEREIKADEEGFFDIWDLPPGTYDVSFRTPQGWRMDRARVIPPEGRGGWVKTPTNSLSIPIVAQKHTEITSILRIDNEISGKVLSPTGSPMKGVCVSAYWLTPTSDSYMIPSNCTDEKGDFRISELPPGKYRIEINNRGAVTASNPFETFYYPGVQDKEKAEAVFVKEGVSVHDLVIRVAKTSPLIKISGQLNYKGGNPVPNEEVRFDPRDDTKYERVQVETDENGKFSFELPIGAKGDLKAKTNIWVIQFEKCAEALALRKTRTGRAADVQSNVIMIDGQGPQENLKLVYPIICQ